MLTDLARHTLDSQSTEYKFVAKKFNQSWTNYRNKLPVPGPACPSPSMPLGPLTSSPSVNIPSTNNHPPSSFQPGVLQGFGTNPRVQPPPQMPPLPGLFLEQQIDRSPILYPHANVPNQLTNHRIVRACRSRSVNDGHEISKIIRIERIQNQRWFKQYSAHDCEFRQKLGKPIEQWLFHG
jgi:hypothetical protein